MLSNAVAARMQSLSQRLRYIQNSSIRVAMKTKDVAKIETIYISFFFGSRFSTQSIISNSISVL